jgi:DNA-binding SARP family transcriptional activator
MLWPAGIELASVASVPRQVASEIAASFDQISTHEDTTIRDDEVWPIAVHTARQEYPVADPAAGPSDHPGAVLDELSAAEPGLGNVDAVDRQTDALTEITTEGAEDPAADPAENPFNVGDDDDLPLVGVDGEIDLVVAGELLGGCEDEWDVPAPELLVSVLGPLRFGDHELRPRDVSLIAFMALNGHQATHDDLRDAIWRGRAVSAKTIQNTISKIRGATHDTLIVSGGDAAYVLDERVRTDLDVFTEIVANADGCSSAREIDLLQKALGMVRNIPFTDETACEWSVESQHFSKACQMIEAAALRLVELANEAGDHQASRSALQVGCAALRGNEPLYRALIDLNYRRGDQAAMTAAWKELEGILETLGTGPSQDSIELYESLKSATGSR